MNRQNAEEWLNKLKEYWFNKDIEGAIALFTKTNFLSRNSFFETIYNIWWNKRRVATYKKW